MTQPETTKTELASLVKYIIELGPNNFAKLFEIVINALIEAEASYKLGADRYERSEGRTNSRNGYRRRKKPLKTPSGPIEVRIPKFRRGSFYPAILERYSRVDRAIISIICEAYYAGVSTRKMSQLFKDLGLANIDRSLVSRCAATIDSEIENWRNRQLDSCYAYIWVDAIYTKIRIDGAVRSTAVLVAIGVSEDGYRDVLGFHLGNRESYHNWKDFFQSLKARGLERSELWISDEHDGLIKAIEECFPSQLRQRCIVHWMRNVKSKVSKAELHWLLPRIKDLVNSSTRESFAAAWSELIKAAQARGKDKLLDWLDSTYHEITAYLNFPPSHWKKIKSTNPIERLNEELRRRERCIRIFPNDDSCIRLFGAILQYQSDDWISGYRYIVSPMEAIRENQKSPMTLAVKSDGIELCSVGYASYAELNPNAAGSQK